MCHLTPLVDPKCWYGDMFSGRLNGPKPKDVDKDDVHRLYREKQILNRSNKFMPGNLSLASVHGQLSPWDDVDSYYPENITRSDGKPVGKVFPDNFEEGVWYPSKDQYKIVHADAEFCEITIPISVGGEADWVQVAVEKSLNLEKRGMLFDDSEDLENATITVLKHGDHARLIKDETK
ncbi:hypothetical protein RJ55_05627 [Drechmeria coniospora]|nr:hypothetical protein RJ55_05627 [Drechmeria coniospora]